MASIDLILREIRREILEETRVLKLILAQCRRRCRGDPACMLDCERDMLDMMAEELLEEARSGDEEGEQGGGG